MSKETKVTPSSGNVFADLGLPNADEEAAKVDLAFELSQIIEERALTQTEARRSWGSINRRWALSCVTRWTGSRWSGCIGS